MIGKTALEIFPPAPPRSSQPTTTRPCRTRRRPVRGRASLGNPGDGPRYMNSRRLGIRGQAGEPRYLVNVVEDVTERRRANENIAHLAHYDALTDLPNRVLFREQLEQAFKRPARRAFGPALYRHRRVQGHQQLARASGRRRAVEGRRRPPQRLPPATDMVARLGGDEFAVIQTAVGDRDDVSNCHADPRGDPAPHHWLGHQLSPRQHRHRAGAAGRHRSDQLSERRHGDVRGQGRTDVEPIVSSSRRWTPASRRGCTWSWTCVRRSMAASKSTTSRWSTSSNERGGCEALLRWRHPERGMISPAEFIPSRRIPA